MAKEKEKVDQEAALVEVIGKCANLEVKVKALEELTGLQGKSISTLIEKNDDLEKRVKTIENYMLTNDNVLESIISDKGSIGKKLAAIPELEKVIDDIVKQLSATRVPVPEKELAEIKKFLVEKYHYKGN